MAVWLCGCVWLCVAVWLCSCGCVAVCVAVWLCVWLCGRSPCRCSLMVMRVPYHVPPLQVLTWFSNRRARGAAQRPPPNGGAATPPATLSISLLGNVENAGVDGDKTEHKGRAVASEVVARLVQM